MVDKERTARLSGAVAEKQYLIEDYKVSQGSVQQGSVYNALGGLLLFSFLSLEPCSWPPADSDCSTLVCDMTITLVARSHSGGEVVDRTGREERVTVGGRM